jgi:hypothetical protein
VENGALVGEVTPETLLKQNSFIIWRGGSTKDFELKVEYRISADGNSGVNYRSTEVPGAPRAMRGYQADIDGRNRYTGQNYEERGRTFNAMRGQITQIRPGKKAEVIGSLGDAKELESFIKNGDWNAYHLIARGNILVHILNGHVMSMVIDDDTGGHSIHDSARTLFDTRIHGDVAGARQSGLASRLTRIQDRWEPVLRRHSRSCGVPDSYSAREHPDQFGFRAGRADDSREHREARLQI